MKNVILFLVILWLSACTTKYVYLNTCLPDICDMPVTVEDYIVGYECKSEILKSCNKNPSD